MASLLPAKLLLSTGGSKELTTFHLEMLFGAALGEMDTRGHFCPIFLRGVVSIHLHLAGHYLMFAGTEGQVMKMLRVGFHGRRKYLNHPII